MRARARRLSDQSEGVRLPGPSCSSIACPVAFAALMILVSAPVLAVGSLAQEKAKLPRPRQLDQGITWQRDPATGDLRPKADVRATRGTDDAAQPSPGSIRIVTQLVPVTCSVSTADGIAVPGLVREDFRVFDDGREQTISYFDASTLPASVALVMDASPSVLRDSGEMKRAAGALIDALAPLDEAAVVDFAAHTYLQLPFSDVRERVRRAVARIDVRQLLGDTGGSNIYEAVYLTARELFAGRSGRKAIALLTDGQDSGLRLTLDPASASPQPGAAENRLTFDDVARTLAAEDIQIFAVSTENRPKVMAPEWLAAHRDKTLVTPEARQLAIPPYTLYLAELVRRTGGQLYFLREAETMADTFRRIAEAVRAEYTLGYYPSSGPAASGHEGWHQLRVEVEGQGHTVVIHRAAYYVSQAK
jgi:Ca-activated chloride channel family protein